MSSSSLITHERTAISKQNREIEDDLVASLNDYLNIIRGVLDKSKTKWTSFKSILVPKFHPIVEQSIRQAATLSYQLGAAYTTEKVGLPSFLTTTDVQNIKLLTDEFTGKFFGRIQLAIDNTVKREFATAEAPDSFINPNYIATSIAIGVCTKSLAEGSLLKARSIVTNGRSSAGVMQGAAAAPKRKKKAVAVVVAKPAIDTELEELQDEVDFALDIAEEEEDPNAISDLLTTISSAAFVGTAASQLSNMSWVWVTANDATVCPICLTFDGQVFSMLDPTVPLPFDSTHFGCRCRLLLV